MKPPIPKMSFERLVLLMDLDAARFHAQFVNDNLKREQTKFNKEVKAKLKAIRSDSEFASEARDWYVDDHDAINRRVPEAQWKAQFIYAFSVLESTLLAICKEVARTDRLRDNLKKEMSHGFEGSKRFLAKTFETTIFASDSWTRIGQMAKLRHIIVHAGGALHDESDDLTEVKSLQKKWKGLKVLDYNDEPIDLKSKERWFGRIVLDATFVLDSIKLFTCFAAELCDAPTRRKAKT